MASIRLGMGRRPRREPELSRRVAGPDLDEVLEAMADLSIGKPSWPATRAGWQTWSARQRASQGAVRRRKNTATRGAHPTSPARSLERHLDKAGSAHRG